MKKSDISQPPSFFDTYIKFVEDIELTDALKQNITELDNLDFDALNKLANFAYAEGKWTVKDIFQHLIDTERVMSYRALSFGRNDIKPLPGFDENIFAKHVSTKKRSLKSLFAEYKLVHKSTIALFKTFDKKALKRFGIMFNSEMSVLAIGFMLVGHQKHHLKVIKERYMNQNK